MGAIEINGEDDRQSARPARPSSAGVAHVPEDRHGVGSAPNLSVADNLMMKSYRERAGRARLG